MVEVSVASRGFWGAEEAGLSFGFGVEEALVCGEGALDVTFVVNVGDVVGSGGGADCSSGAGVWVRRWFFLWRGDVVERDRIWRG